MSNVSIPKDTAKAIAKLLEYSLEPIHYDFNRLSVGEKAVIETPDNLAKLKTFVKSNT